MFKISLVSRSLQTCDFSGSYARMAYAHDRSLMAGCSLSLIIILQLFVTCNGQSKIVAPVDLVEELDLLLSHLIIELAVKLLQEFSPVVLDLLKVLHGIGLLRRIRLLFHHFYVQFNHDVHEFFDDIEYFTFWDTLFE